MSTKKKNTIPHRDRKNPRSREDYRAKKHEQNALRGRQIWSEKLEAWLR